MSKEMTSVPVYTAVYAYRRVSLFSGLKGELDKSLTCIPFSRIEIGVERQYLFKNASLEISF